jgi:phage tail-like protein
MDRYFQLLLLEDPTPTTPEPGSFLPELPGEPTAGPPAISAPRGLGLPDLDPTAVEALPDGSLLVLVRRAGVGSSSRLLHYRPGVMPGTLLPPPSPLPLPDLSDITAEQDFRPVIAYDMAFSPQDSLLYVVEQDGNQAIAFRLSLPRAPGEQLAAEPLAIYQPMHSFGGRALAYGVTPGGESAIFYDVTPRSEQDALVRWVRLHRIDQPRYTRLAWLETQPFDSRQRGCVWHRLFLDACIPPETEVQVWTRAGDDQELLANRNYRREPSLYLRGRGAEIPHWDGWKPADMTAAQAAYIGSWELLFQAAEGRYLQVRLVLTGNGQASPRITRLRAYYPRFSYVKKYLPAAYREEQESAGFLERFLANMEGFYSDLEGKIAGAGLLFDPRSAPADTLDWLAAWMGLVLDPLWSKIEQNDRRRLLIRFAGRLYERRGTSEGLRFALLLLLDPCLEDTLKRLELAATVPNAALRQELERLGLPYPTLATREDQIEDLLYHYVLAAPGRDRVRIVERWQTRRGLALQAGDVTQGQPAAAESGSLEQEIRDTAHFFSVLVPEDLPAEHTAMVEKIVRLEKPAHTDYDLRRFWDFFMVGQARLGTDTVLGEDGRFLPIILGRDYLSEGYLENAYPMDVTERTVSDRDRMGKMKL